MLMRRCGVVPATGLRSARGREGRVADTRRLRRRPAAGAAEVSLVLDSDDGHWEDSGGRMEITRRVYRSGPSEYRLNGKVARLKDVIDELMTVGLGTRNYSIIEQGMISRIIEARPEDLRVYLEEAAGISKYKERRRETENRMAHTRENLERLDDLREEVQKQLRHLERQAATAQKYKSLREEERRAKAELLVLRLDAMSADIEQRDRAIAEQENRLEAALAEQRRLEAGIEQRRSAHADANDGFNEIQGRFYAVGSEIARLEEMAQDIVERAKAAGADQVEAG